MFKKGRKKVPKGNVRKRARDSDEEDHTEVVRVAKKETKLLSFKSASAKSSSETMVTIESTRDAKPMEYAGGATYIQEVDTARDRDTRAQLERAVALNEAGLTNDDTKMYKGQAAYKNYVGKDAASVGAGKYTGLQGPIRAPQFVRSSCRFDYQPDVCKDYKETGYCGFGDSCKFMHDRGDYKSGWQIEREWKDEQEKKKKVEMGMLEEEEEENYEISDDDDDDLPFACLLCRQDFVSPVVTQCGHYFCERCALNHYSSSSRCAACDKQTHGVFNVATKLIAKLKQAKKLQRQEEGEEGDDEEEADEEREKEEKRKAGRRKRGAWGVVDTAPPPAAAASGSGEETGGDVAAVSTTAS